ncbi:hypothetical protein GF337_05440 [candidate division KSB1 bacterium]|nr:hypothetical protein [candidate division KSB1 bacterium]
MKKFNKLQLFSTALLLTAFAMFVLPDISFAKPWQLKVMKVDGEWRVVDATDTTKSNVRVKRNDTIEWTAEGSDVYFQFSSDLRFVGESAKDKLDGGYTKYLPEGKKLKLKVKKDAPLGEEVYAVFVKSENVFAKGGSPPIIIVVD